MFWFFHMCLTLFPEVLPFKSRVIYHSWTLFFVHIVKVIIVLNVRVLWVWIRILLHIQLESWISSICILHLRPLHEMVVDVSAFWKCREGLLNFFEPWIILWFKVGLSLPLSPWEFLQVACTWNKTFHKFHLKQWLFILNSCKEVQWERSIPNFHFKCLQYNLSLSFIVQGDLCWLILTHFVDLFVSMSLTNKNVCQMIASSEL